MSEPTTDVASNEGDAVVNNPELTKLEQAVNAEAGQTENPETSSEESQAENAPEHGEAFASLAEKKGFKNVDDLVQAYQNAESYSSKMSQQLKGIRDEIRQSNAPQKKDPYADLPQQQKEALQMLRSVVQDEIGKSLSPLREDLEVKRAGEEISQVRSSITGITDAQMDEAVSLVEKNPSLSLEQAAKLATYETTKSQEQVQKKRAAQTQQKKRAFVESASTSKTGGDIDYSKLSLEELENIIPSSGQFVDSKGVLRR